MAAEKFSEETKKLSTSDLTSQEIDNIFLDTWQYVGNMVSDRVIVC